VADLFVESRREDDVAFVLLTGEARLELCANLRARGLDLLRAGARHLVVDVDALSFVDSASMGVLLEMRRKAVDAGGSMTFVRSTERFRRRLDDMGIRAQFAYAPSEAEAVTALGRPRPTPPSGAPPPSRA